MDSALIKLLLKLSSFGEIYCLDCRNFEFPLFSCGNLKAFDISIMSFEWKEVAWPVMLSLEWYPKAFPRALWCQGKKCTSIYGAHPWCGKKRMLSLLRIESKTKDASAHGLLLCGGSCSSKDNCEKDTHRY